MASDSPIRFRCAALRRSGAFDIRVIYADSADVARDRLIAAGLEPVTIEPIGPSLSSRFTEKLSEEFRSLRRRSAQSTVSTEPRRQLTARPLLAMASLLAIAIFTLMIGSWALVLGTRWQTHQIMRESAASMARYRELISDERDRALARPVMTAPGATEVLARLAALLPADTGLEAAGRDREGVLWLELEAPDPDQIRPLLARDPLFRSLQEVGQERTGQGTMRVTWKSASR